MSNEFPHLKDTTFPNLSNVNVYEFQNSFDYSKFANSQMHIKLMSVPWDLGEVHVGMKSIPLGNVVSFETDKKRDEWLNAQDGLEFDTRYRAYHSTDEIKLPIPFESCSMFNYIVIDYEESPVQYGNMPRITRWLYFIRDVKMESVNSTICTIQRDSWQMFSNSVNISYLYLERGHAPMFDAATPEEFLKAPINNTAGLLAEDVNYGVASNVKEFSYVNFSEENRSLVFCLNANIDTGDWGSKADSDWCVPRQVYNKMNGALAPHTFAIAISTVETFFTNVDADFPQFFQCVEACFVVPKMLTYVSGSFKFAGVTCYPVLTSSEVFRNLSFPDVPTFDFGNNFKNLTKLYTSPYSHIEITDEKGNVTVVNVEDCTGSLSVRASLSLAFPWLRIAGQINGIGGDSRSFSFFNLDSHSFTHGGRWYDTLRQWEIPCMQVQQGNNKTNDYQTHYDRLATTEIANSNATTTTEDAATNTAAALKVAKENADCLTDNTATQCSANTTMTARSATGATKDTTLANELSVATQAWNAGMSRDLVNNSADAAIQSASLSTTSNILSGAASGAITGAVAGSVAPGLGTVAGAVLGGLGGLASGVASGIVSGMQTGIAINSSKEQAEIQINNSDVIMTSTNKNNTQRTSNQNDISKDNTATQNTASKSQASRSASAMTTNQTTTNSATNAVAANDAANMRDIASITNKRQQDSAHIQAPNTFGRVTDVDNVTRPMGLFAQVVKQPADAIAQAANEFLRYGYYYRQMYEFNGFNVGEKFTYWKASDLWMTAPNLPDAFVDEIRNYLLQGVTIWRRPEDINNTSIYENGI